MMFWLRLISGGILLVLSAWLITANGLVFWRGVAGRGRVSYVPFVGGVVGAVALVLLPFTATNKGWWLPLLLDWGSLPGLAYALFWQMGKRRKQWKN